MSTISVIVVITIFFTLAVPLITSQVYWWFLDKRIKDKKALLSFLEPAYKVAVYAVTGCLGISLILVFVIEYATTIEYSGMPLVPMVLFLVYLTFLSIPYKLISDLKTSIEEEKNAINSTLVNIEDVGQ